MVYSCRATWNRDKLQGSLGTETNSASNHLSAGSLQVQRLCQVCIRLLAASPVQMRMASEEEGGVDQSYPLYSQMSAGCTPASKFGSYEVTISYKEPKYCFAQVCRPAG